MELEYRRLGHPESPLSELCKSALFIDYAALCLWLEMVHEWTRFHLSMMQDVSTFGVYFFCSLSRSKLNGQLPGFHSRNMSHT